MMKYFYLVTLTLLFFSCRQSAGNKETIDVNKIEAAIIEVELKDSSSLFILLANDGTINRKGDLKSRDKNLFMGISQEQHFDKLKGTITDGLLAYCNPVYVIKDTLKKANKITIAFSGPGIETGFEYYTNEPVNKLPKPILDFINNAIKITDPWFKNQRDLIKPKALNSRHG